jgi:hypothetical protein
LPRVRFATAFAKGEPANNGDNRIRTGDPLLAKQVLYQLSYVPRNGHQPSIVWWAREDLNLRPHAYQACALTN